VRRWPAGDPFVTRWQHAALALAEGAVDPIALELHLAHLRDQMPDDPRVRLGHAIAAEQHLSPVQTTRVDVRVEATINPAREQAERERRKAVAIDLLQELRADPALQAEASLRLARLFQESNRASEAVALLNQLDRLTTDPVLRYLGYVFEGRGFERLGRTPEAREAYRRALQIGPNAHAATLAMAALLFRAGESAEADRLVTTLVRNPDPTPDPWWTYWGGDVRLWSTRLRAMREAVR
jgi:tetratricopeptide (TPR) repeat protein